MMETPTSFTNMAQCRLSTFYRHRNRELCLFLLAWLSLCNISYGHWGGRDLVKKIVIKSWRLTSFFLSQLKTPGRIFATSSREIKCAKVNLLCIFHCLTGWLIWHIKLTGKRWSHSVSLVCALRNHVLASKVSNLIKIFSEGYRRYLALCLTSSGSQLVSQFVS